MKYYYMANDYKKHFFATDRNDYGLYERIGSYLYNQMCAGMIKDFYVEINAE